MRSRIVLGICVTLLLAGTLFADSDFSGAVSKFWSNPDNWSAGVPGVNDKANIRNGVSVVIDYDAGIIKNLALEGGASTVQLVNGAQLGVNDWSIIGYNGGDAETPHLLEVFGGVYNANARMFIGFLGSGKLILDGDGVINLNAQEFGIGENTNGNGVVELRGGALNLLSSSGLPLRFRAGANSSASMDFSGGVMTQAYSDARAKVVNDHIADGTITAYGGVGTVIVETAEDKLVVKGRHPLNPVPEDGGSALPGSITLNWTPRDPCTPGGAVAVDVYFTDNLQALEQFFDPAAIRVVNKQAVTSVSVQTQPKKRYYWAVDCYVGSPTDPVYGPIFSFVVDNMAPRVDAGPNIVTWLQDGSRTGNLDATVTDEDAFTVKWTVVSTPAGAPAPVIQSPTAEDTAVTFTATGRYVLQLDASDSEYTGSDTVTIDVYNDSCEAAQAVPGYQPIVGDLNGDCRVDDADMALLQENWLQDNSLTQDWFPLP